MALSSWARMLAELRRQLDPTERARVPAQLRRVWSGEIGEAMDASAAWLASRRRDSLPRTALAPSVRARRGDTYSDLADAFGGLALAGDGALDLARLRARYTIERGPWLGMVADLLGQVVADAGSVERVASTLAVREDRLLVWVRWFVSRGSLAAAVTRWPVAASSDDLDPAAYDDLAEAVERGAVAGDNAIDPPWVRDSYTVRLDSWARMEAELLGQIVADAGSIRRAAKLLGVPRSTLGGWLRAN